MSHRASIRLSLVLLLLIPGAPLAADQPDCTTASPLAPGSLTVWPLRERLANDSAGGYRSGLMSSFGEFQSYGTTYVHTGIDVRGLWNSTTSEGDLVFVTASGDVWAVPAFTADSCTSNNLCRVYVKSTDRRHVYYYSHLNVRTDADSEVRAKLENVANTNPANDLPPGSNPVTAGQKLAGLGPFDNAGSYTHLHFSIFDACDNYDGLSPLIYLPAPQSGGSPYVDETAPEIAQLAFLRDGSQTEVPAGGCATPVDGMLDLVLEAREAYHDLTGGTPAFAATHSNGVHRATYRIRRTPSGTPTYDGTWYDFDQAPYRCRGEQQGTACTDPVNGAPLTQTDFIQTVAELPPFGVGGPNLAVTFAEVLFNDQPGSFNSSSDYSGTERYFHLLTHEWGYGDQPGRWDTTAIPNGRYQVSAEVSDVAGNEAAVHEFVLVHNGGAPPQATGDLVIRDNPADVGAVPSTLGGEKFWISPDIKVTGAGDPAPTDPNAATWSTVQDVDVVQGQPYQVWVRVKNTGCETIHNVRARVAWANPAMIQTEWQEIGSETGPGVSLMLDEATVLGPFDWTPTAAQVGHRCLLSITRANDDAATVAGFGNIADGWGGTVANDNNVGQLNLQVHGTSEFMILNPRTSEADVGLRFDCNELPIYEEGAVAELVADHHPALETAWSRVPRTELRREGGRLALRFAGCVVELPPARLPGGTVIPASFRLELGTGPDGLYRVDLGQTVEGELAGGMSFTIRRLAPIP